MALIVTVLPFNVDSGLNVKVGVKLPSINVKLPSIKLPTIKITTVIKHSRSKKPLKIALPAISFDAEAEKEKSDDWWEPTPEPWSEPETESTPTGWGDTDPWSSTTNDEKSEHEQIDKWLAEKRRKQSNQDSSGWNEVKEDSWSTTDDHRPSSRTAYSDNQHQHQQQQQPHYPADGYSKSDRPQPYPAYPYPPSNGYSGWPTGGWSGWGWGHWPAWPYWPAPHSTASTTKAPMTKEEKKEDPPKEDI